MATNSKEDGNVTSKLQRSNSDLRKVRAQNERERLACEEKTHALERQRSTVNASLQRQEGELRAQIERLELERNAMAAKGEEGSEMGSTPPDDLVSLDLSNYGAIETVVTNPYPITILSKKQLQSGARKGRLSSASLSSAEVAETRGLPIVHSGSRNSLVGSRCDSRMLASHSCASLNTPRGATARSPSSQGLEEETKDSLWVGDPEAIQSIRRPRRSVVQQQQARTEAQGHAWTRSRSLKERQSGCGASVVSSVSTSSMKTTGLNRSQSLRDPPQAGKGRGGLLSPGRLSRTSSHSSGVSQGCVGIVGGCPGTVEADGVGEFRQSIECLVDAATESELNRGPAHRCLRRHLAAIRRSGGTLTESQQLYGTSPDTKSTVWGWIRDLDPNTDAPPDATSTADDLGFDQSNLPIHKTGSSRTSETSENAMKVKRVSSLKDNIKKRRKPKELASISANCVGTIGDTPLIPSPSQLSVERCYELLASDSINKTPGGIMYTKLAPISSGANAKNV